MTDYDDPTTNAYYDRKAAEETIKYEAKQAERMGYSKVAKELWDAYYALLEEAQMEEVRAAEEVKPSEG